MSRQSAANSSREASRADPGSLDLGSLSLNRDTSGPTARRSSAITHFSSGNFLTALMASQAEGSAGPSSAAPPAVVGQTPGSYSRTFIQGLAGTVNELITNDTARGTRLSGFAEQLELLSAKAASTSDTLADLQRATDDNAAYTDGRLASIDTQLSSLISTVDVVKAVVTAQTAAPKPQGPLDKAAVDLALADDAAITKSLPMYGNQWACGVHSL